MTGDVRYKKYYNLQTHVQCSFILVVPLRDRVYILSMFLCYFSVLLFIVETRKCEFSLLVALIEA